MADETKLYLIASDVCLSKQKSNEIFLLIQARLLSDRANGNSQGVTPAFIDQIVQHPETYACLPLYVDKDRLLRGDYQSLGHLYDKQTGRFGTQQCGAITSFRKEFDEYGTSLIAELRIPKRQLQICECVEELYNKGQLNFSFEIKYNANHVVKKDGVTYVDVYESNAMTGLAIVTTPAYEESTALSMIAQIEQATKEAEGVEEQMDIKEMEAALAAKDEEMAKVIAEKDAVIAERDATIAELNNSIAAKKQCAEDDPEMKEEEKKEEEQDMQAEKKECAEDKNACSQDKECAEDKKVCAEDKECAEDKKACAEMATAGLYEMECMQQEINRLRVELASAAAAKSELETIKAEMAAKELEANQAMAKAFAEKQGLNVDDECVSKAIAELDYKMIAELSMKNEDHVEETKVVVASMAGDGFVIKGGKYDDLLAPRK